MVVGLLAQAAMAEEHGDAPINPLSGNLGNAIATLVIFVLVLVVLSKVAWKPILEGLQRRERFIRESLETAKRDREAAEARLHEYEQKLLAAREEASRIVDEGRRDGENVKRQIESDARAAGDAMLERAKREIGVARDSILKRQVSAEDHAQLIQEALAGLKADERRN